MTTKEPSRSVNAADLLAAIGWPTRDLDAHGPQRNRHHAENAELNSVWRTRMYADADGDTDVYAALPQETHHHRRVGRFARLAAAVAGLFRGPRFQVAIP